MPACDAADYQAVFDYFGIDQRDRPEKSVYPYAPVFRTTVAGIAVAVKRTRRNPRSAEAIARWVRDLAARGIAVVTPIDAQVPNPGLIGDRMWVAYPWVDGREYDGSSADIAAAGTLLGRTHACTDYLDPAMPPFKWPDYDEAEVEEEIANLGRVLECQAPEIARRVLPRTNAWHRSFMDSTLPAIRDSSLPLVSATTDFKANNLVYAAAGPVLIDPDNSDYMPRIIDLAIAALLFHNEMPTAPPRMFTPGEWTIFAEAYEAQVTLTDLERELWPVAIRYVATEWGTWTLLAAEEWDDWADPHLRAFLADLAGAEPARFPLNVTESP